MGNVAQRTDYNGAVTNYTYDNLNRLVTINYPVRTATYSYDPLNNLTRATNENGSVYIGYDNRYRVSSFSDPFFYGVSYNYDAAGNRTRLKLNGATYATYTYDAVNRLTNLADSANQNFPHLYDGVNRLTSRGAPNGVTSSYVYDGLNRLTDLTHAAGASTLLANQYTYNDSNNIATWNNAAGNHVYGYDSVDRLTSATNAAQPNESYAYDGVGNRTSSHLSSSYSYQPFNRWSDWSTRERLPAMGLVYWRLRVTLKALANVSPGLSQPWDSNA